MPIQPIIFKDAPDPVNISPAGDAGKVDSAVRRWAKDLTFQVRALYTTVQGLKTATAASTAEAADDTGAATPTSAVQKIDVPASPPSDGDLVIFDGSTGAKVRSGGKPNSATSAVPKNFPITLDLGVLNPGAASNFNYDVPIGALGLTVAPSGGIGIGGSSLPNKLLAALDVTSALTTSSSARFKVYSLDGAALPAVGSYVVNFMVFP